MIKTEELKRADSCLNKARDNELLFVLLERDPAAAVAVQAWINERLRLCKNEPGDDQIVEALDWARRVTESHSTGKAENFKLGMGYRVGEDHDALDVPDFLKRQQAFAPSQEFTDGIVDPNKPGYLEHFAMMVAEGWEIMCAWTIIEHNYHGGPGVPATTTEKLRYIARRAWSGDEKPYPGMSVRIAKCKGRDLETQISELLEEGWTILEVAVKRKEADQQHDCYILKIGRKEEQ